MSYDVNKPAEVLSATPPKRYLKFADWHRKSALREVMRQELQLEQAAKKQK